MNLAHRLRRHAAIGVGRGNRLHLGGRVILEDDGWCAVLQRRLGATAAELLDVNEFVEARLEQR